MKALKITALVLAAGILFAGCAKSDKKQVRKPSASINTENWIDNLIDGKAAAVKENKKIFLFFSGDDQDGASRELKDLVFDTPAFKDFMTPKYVLVNLDFSNSLFDAAQADPLASEEEKKAAADIMEKLEEGMRDASVYNIQATPAFYILTKEGYVVSEVIFQKKLETTDDFIASFETYGEKIAVYENTLASTKTGKNEDRLAAINKLFELTDPQQRFLLKEKSEEYVKLDKKNSTGMVGTHVVSMANAKAFEAYLEQNPLAASEEFAKAAENKFLKPEEKQQCYYTAGYLFAQSGTEDYAKVKEYFQKAYDADPESQYAPTIQSMMRMMEERFAEQAPATEPEVPSTEATASERISADTISDNNE